MRRGDVRRLFAGSRAGWLLRQGQNSEATALAWPAFDGLSVGRSLGDSRDNERRQPTPVCGLVRVWQRVWPGLAAIHRSSSSSTCRSKFRSAHPAPAPCRALLARSRERRSQPTATLGSQRHQGTMTLRQGWQFRSCRASVSTGTSENSANTHWPCVKHLRPHPGGRYSASPDFLPFPARFLLAAANM